MDHVKGRESRACGPSVRSQSPDARRAGAGVRGVRVWVPVFVSGAGRAGAGGRRGPVCAVQVGGAPVSAAVMLAVRRLAVINCPACPKLLGAGGLGMAA